MSSKDITRGGSTSPLSSATLERESTSEVPPCLFPSIFSPLHEPFGVRRIKRGNSPVNQSAEADTHASVPGAWWSTTQRASPNSLFCSCGRTFASSCTVGKAKRGEMRSPVRVSDLVCGAALQWTFRCTSPGTSPPSPSSPSTTSPAVGSSTLRCRSLIPTVLAGTATKWQRGPSEYPSGLRVNVCAN